MNLLTLTEIRRAAQTGSVSARVHVEVEAATAKTQREGKPYCELTLADACDRPRAGMLGVAADVEHRGR